MDHVTSPLTVEVEASPHPWETRFAEYAATAAGWMGGDSTYTVPLTSGHRLWLFSDTRLPSDRWINNSVVTQHPDGTLHTVHGGTAADPAALVRPTQPCGEDGLARWLWASDAYALEDPDLATDEHRLWMFCQEYRSTKPNPERSEWDFAWVRTVLAEVALPDLRVLARTPIEDGTGVQWGAALHRHGDDLLIYGVADEGEHKHLLMATAPAREPGRNWLYRTADRRWSARPEQAARLLTGVSNEITVLPLPDRDDDWLLVTSDTTTPFGTWPIVAYRSTSPVGPWSGPIEVYDPPEAGGSRYAYNPTLVPVGAEQFVLAYNVNDTFAEVLADPTIYRPRFRALRITRPAAADDDGGTLGRCRPGGFRPGT